MRGTARLPTAVLAAVLLAGCAMGAARRGGESAEDCLRRHALDYRARHAVPALSLALSAAGSPPVAVAVGVADPATDEAVTPRHRFRIASVSKPITALAAMRLVETGALSLDTPVFGADGVLGERLLDADSDPRLRDITVRHLLEHSAGFDPGPPDPVFALPGDDIDALLRHVLGEPLLDAPGRRHRYSNIGYLLLGRVIQARAGTSYEAFVRDILLRPAGVAGMDIGADGVAGRGADEVVYAGALAYAAVRPARMQAHGGWIATPSELLRLLAVVHGETETPAPISPATLRRMTRPSAPPLPDGRSSRYGLGWEIDARGHGHLGAMPGTLAVLYRRADGRAVAALANARPASDEHGHRLWRQARRALACR